MSGPGLDLVKRKLKKILLGEVEEVEDNIQHVKEMILNNRLAKPGAELTCVSSKAR